MTSGYGDKADRIIWELEQRNADLASEVERLRRVERELRIELETIDRGEHGSN